ncbi:MAG: thioredoxin [Nitrospirae bacterium]|nr:thioredoxin [Nitrospirota bacterium]
MACQGTTGEGIQTGNDHTFDEMARSGGLVLAEFWGAWCADCDTVGAAVNAVAAEFSGHLRVVRLQVERNPETTRRHGIVTLPTLLFFKDGTVVGRHIGGMALPALRARIAELLG